MKVTNYHRAAKIVLASRANNQEQHDMDTVTVLIGSYSVQHDADRGKYTVTDFWGRPVGAYQSMSLAIQLAAVLTARSQEAFIDGYRQVRYDAEHQQTG